MVKRIAIFAILALIGGMAYCIGAFFFFGFDLPVAAHDLGDGYTIRIWGECRPGKDFCPYIYYEITKLGKVVVPPTFLAIQPESGDIKVAFAGKGNLVCIYDTRSWDDDFFLIIFDKRSGDSFPGDWRTADDSKWAELYKQLQLENPSLPPAFP